jgi:hypothetical protein
VPLYGREGRLDHDQGMTILLGILGFAAPLKNSGNQQCMARTSISALEAPLVVSNASSTPKRTMDAEILAATALAPVRGNATASAARIRYSDEFWSTCADEF